MKEIVEKWNGGAKRHEGIGKAMSVQDKLIQSPEEQAKGVNTAPRKREVSQRTRGKS